MVNGKDYGCTSMKQHMKEAGVQTYDVNTTVLNMGNHLGIEGPEMEI